MKKKKKDIPFHIAHNYKYWTLGDNGPKFWASNKENAKLYCEHIGWSPLALKEEKIKWVK